MTISIYTKRAYPRNLKHCLLGEDSPLRVSERVLFGTLKRRKGAWFFILGYFKDQITKILFNYGEF